MTRSFLLFLSCLALCLGQPCPLPSWVEEQTCSGTGDCTLTFSNVLAGDLLIGICATPFSTPYAPLSGWANVTFARLSPAFAGVVQYSYVTAPGPLTIVAPSTGQFQDCAFTAVRGARLDQILLADIATPPPIACSGGACTAVTFAAARVPNRHCTLGLPEGSEHCAAVSQTRASEVSVAVCFVQTNTQLLGPHKYSCVNDNNEEFITATVSLIPACIGNTGAAGQPGPTGATGGVGAQGNTGAAGAAGSTGTGGTGANGATGATGGTGAIGPTGSQGYTGATGAAGAGGSPGAQGATGANGATGATGALGGTGFAGATGAVGAQGNPGTPGATGAAGIAGAGGSTGATGAQGQAGATGAQGIPGAFAGTGAAGATGATGANGAKGETGTTGATGAFGSTGANGAQGNAGASGSSGATGAAGRINSSLAVWLNLTLAKSVTHVEGITYVWPACFPDVDGTIYLRGHVTLSPVPATGSALLALFPKDANGVCRCTPQSDPGTTSNSVIASTTALSYPRNRVNNPDVCIVRLLITSNLIHDVNLDHVINETDVEIIEASPFYTLEITSVPNCPIVLNKSSCGRVDTNEDGFVNALDVTSVRQSGYMGTNVECGGVYATHFSCGSTRAAPLTPADSISLDNVFYFSSDGETGPTSPLTKRRHRAVDRSLMADVLVQFDQLHNTVAELQQQLVAVDGKAAAAIAKSNAVEAELHSKMTQSQRADTATTHRGWTQPKGDATKIQVGIGAVIVLLAGALVCLALKRKTSL